MKALRSTMPMALLALALALPARAAKPTYAIGKNYFFAGATQVKRCDAKGTLAVPEASAIAPSYAFFKVTDTLATGAVVQFWTWPSGEAQRTALNFENGDATKPRYFFLVPKEDMMKKATEQVKDSPTTKQEEVDKAGPPPTKDEMLALDTSRRVLGEDRSFIYSIGTNFDFIDNVQTSKTYHDLRVWVPNLAKDRTSFLGRMGFEFGFNRFRTFSTPDSSEAIFRGTRPLMVVSGPDTTYKPLFLTNTVKDKVTSRFDNVGLALNPFLRLSGHSRKDVVFAITGLLEWQRSVLSTTTTRAFNEVETETVPDEWPVPYDLNYNLPAASETVKTTTDNFYGGGGFRLMYRDDWGTLNLRATAGYSYTLIASGDMKQLFANEAPFYALQAEIIESKVSGVKIGTEIRGFFIDNPTDPIRTLPRFNLYIAKEFRLKKIGELFTKE